MSNEDAVAKHYGHGDLLRAIETALTKLGKTIDSVTVSDLAAVDEFHIGGRVATERLLDQLKVSADTHFLDVGCGLGGASRFVASTYHNRVTGIDLSQEYIDTGRALSSWLKLDDQVILEQGSALSMPFPNQEFDGAYMMHVGMNIEDKHRLFTEVYRLLRPGSYFGIYDIMRFNDAELLYPVPWAATSSTSHLGTPDNYKQALCDAGFTLCNEIERRDFALEFFSQMAEKNAAAGGPPALSLHTLMQQSTAVKMSNVVSNINAGTIAPVELIAKKL